MRALLAIAVLGIFLIINPVRGFENRDWQEIVFFHVGLVVAVAALARDIHFALPGMWFVVVAAARPSPEALDAIIYTVGFYGLYALSARFGADKIILSVGLVVSGAMALQTMKLYEPMMRLISADYTRTVNNPQHPWAGMLQSTGDAGCVLAMALPFCSGWWVLPIGLALLATGASSAIVAGTLGLAIAQWPRLRRWGFAWMFIGIMGLGLTINLVDGLRGIFMDARWTVWRRVSAHWWSDGAGLFLGNGLGGWASHKFALVHGSILDIWDHAHFDFLQIGFDAGVIGLMFISIAFSWLAIRAYRNGNKKALGGLAALAVAQFGHFPFYLAAPAAVAALITGEAVYEGQGLRN